MRPDVPSKRERSSCFGRSSSRCLFSYSRSSSRRRHASTSIARRTSADTKHSLWSWTQLIRADGVVDERNTLAEKRLRLAVTREFQARGLEATDVGADLVVRVSSRETEQTILLKSGWHHYPRGWSRRWGYWGYGGYWGYPDIGVIGVHMRAMCGRVVISRGL